MRLYAEGAAAQDGDLALRLTSEALQGILDDVPDEWLEAAPGAESPTALRQRYVDFLLARLASPRSWLPVADGKGA